MVRYDEGTRDDGQSLIAFSPAEIETEERIDIAYYIGDDQVTKGRKGRYRPPFPLLGRILSEEFLV